MALAALPPEIWLSIASCLLLDESPPPPLALNGQPDYPMPPPSSPPFSPSVAALCAVSTRFYDLIRPLRWRYVRVLHASQLPRLASLAVAASPRHPSTTIGSDISRLDMVLHREDYDAHSLVALLVHLPCIQTIVFHNTTTRRLQPSFSPGDCLPVPSIVMTAIASRRSLVHLLFKHHAEGPSLHGLAEMSVGCSQLQSLQLCNIASPQPDTPSGRWSFPNLSLIKLGPTSTYKFFTVAFRFQPFLKVLGNNRETAPRLCHLHVLHPYHYIARHIDLFADILTTALTRDGLGDSRILHSSFRALKYFIVDVVPAVAPSFPIPITLPALQVLHLRQLPVRSGLPQSLAIQRRCEDILNELLRQVPPSLHTIKIWIPTTPYQPSVAPLIQLSGRYHHVGIDFVVECHPHLYGTPPMSDRIVLDSVPGP